MQARTLTLLVLGPRYRFRKLLVGLGMVLAWTVHTPLGTDHAFKIQEKKKRWHLESMGAYGRITASHGQVGRPDMRELSRQYQAQRLSQDPHLQRLGELARDTALVGAQPRYGVSSFGPTTRHSQRAHQRRATEGLWSRLRSMTPADRVDWLAKQGVVDLSDVSKIIRMATAQRRMETRARQKTIEAEVEVLKRFESSIGQSQLQRLCYAMPSLTVQGPYVTTIPWPSKCGVCFDWAPYASEAVTRGAGFAGNSRQTNLASNLEREWRETHLPVERVNDPVPAQQSNHKSLCQEVGLCVCQGDGRSIKRLHDLVFQEMRKVFAARSHREELSNGNIVVCFASSGAQDDPDDSVILEELWFHVGMVLFSPYKGCFQVLQRVATPLYDVAGDGNLEKLCLKEGPQISVWVAFALVRILVCVFSRG